MFTRQQQQKICRNDRPDLHDSDEVELGDETSPFSSELPRQAELGPQQRQLTFCRLQCTAAKTINIYYSSVWWFVSVQY
jgi:hypothetical protein